MYIKDTFSRIPGTISFFLEFAHCSDMALTQTTYILNAEDCIIDVSKGWDEFALENRGEKVVANNVVGRKLREFIKGDSTSIWIYSLIQKARSVQREIIRFYRCDSPDEKRYMKMIITPEDDGTVAVTSQLLRTKKMKQRIGFVFSSVATNRKCSICNRISYQDSWLEPDDAKVLGLLKDDEPVPVIYSVCNDCMTKNAKIQSQG